MTVISSLYSGISGIVSNGSALSIAGDNIANMSTPAFKSSVPVFETALSQRLGQAEVGLGTRLARSSRDFTQGDLGNTTRPLDLAIQGSGFFRVRNVAGEVFFTRSGLFEQNSIGEVVTAGGNYLLQGYAIDSQGGVGGTLGNINLMSVNAAPVQTNKIEFSVNLDASAIVPAAFNGTSFVNAEATSNFSVAQTIYDSLGIGRHVITYFNKTANNTWQYHTLTDGSNVSNYAAGQPVAGTVVLAQGTIVFNTDGTRNTVTPDITGDDQDGGGLQAGDQVTPNNAAFGIRWVSATPVMDITHDFGQVLGSRAVTTQYDTKSSTVSNFVQNGRAQGALQSIEIQRDGTLVGNFTNGTSRSLYKIPLAGFANEQGLLRAGSNLFTESPESGVARVTLAQTGGVGEVRSFSVEQSNVDLASEFVRIITLQRAFQASSRTISAATELLQELVNIGR